jgi:glycosyltransferase involved in cell wall biosynthesis
MSPPGPGAPVKVLVFQNRFLIGGQERQTVAHLRTIDRARWHPVVACLHFEGEHLEDLEAIGVVPESLDVRKIVRPQTAWRVMQLARRIQRERIAIVHAQDFYTDLLGTLAARLAGVPSIVTRVDLRHNLGAAKRAALTAASHAATRVLVNALCIRDQCIAEGVGTDRVVVVRNGVDLLAFDEERARPPREPVPDAGRPTVVNVANMHHPVKGQEDLIVAFREVRTSLPEAQLVLVGDGVRRPGLERLARELGLAAHVRFLGHRLDVPALLARSSVATSASYAEGISNAVLEGMATRLPIVATAVGGNPELVREGITGRLVPPGAPAQLAGRLLEVLRDPDGARRMGEAGRLVVEQEFSVEQMRLSYDALYRSCLETTRPPLLAAG